MKLVWVLLCFFTTICTGQVMVDFEDVQVGDQGYWNGEDLSGGFIEDGLSFPNSYDTEWNSWTGWAVSSTKDATTPGFSNQYSSITGSGANNSTQYAVTYVPVEGRIQVQENAMMVKKLYLTNSTYAYWSMKEGDAIAKRFGGASGLDPDYFRIIFKGTYQGKEAQDSVVFYLADYRFEDSDEDYIIDFWSPVSLEELGVVDQITYRLESSDIGQWGMNTPAYFCMDQILADVVSSSDDSKDRDYKISRTSRNSFIVLGNQGQLKSIKLYNATGNFIEEVSLRSDHTIHLSKFPAGVYLVHFEDDSGQYAEKFLVY